jgi:purine catabolism regulator
MPITLAELVAHAHLGLRTVWADEAAAARPWNWVHSSDLADPTPFLGAGDALLTTGTQWRRDDDIAPWLARLAAAGVPGVGFGTEVIRDGTPDALVAACEAHGIALVEVPYRTPFIAVAHAVADADARERYARISWTLEVQRALSIAALRPDGVTAVLAVLGRRIEAPVALLRTGGASPMDADAPEAVAEEALRMLAAGRRAARPVDGWSLQTVGAPGSLAGVLAVGPTTPDDDAVRAVVTSVVAMAGLALRFDPVSEPDASDVGAHARLDRLRGELRRVLIESDPAPTDPPPSGPASASIGAMLEALRTHDTMTGEQLEKTLVAWLREEAVAEAAAVRLGIHRHTVRARLRRAAEVLDRDLSAFSARAELWAALHAEGRV